MQRRRKKKEHISCTFRCKVQSSFRNIKACVWGCACQNSGIILVPLRMISADDIGQSWFDVDKVISKNKKKNKKSLWKCTLLLFISGHWRQAQATLQGSWRHLCITWFQEFNRNSTCPQTFVPLYPLPSYLNSPTVASGFGNCSCKPCGQAHWLPGFSSTSFACLIVYVN